VLLQKQLTSTTLVQFKFELACAKQLDTQIGTPVKLGNCAELVGLPELVELVAPVPVPVVVGVLVLPLATDDVVVDVETVVDVPCDDTTDTKSWRMKNKGIGRRRKFIVLVQ